MFDGFGREQQRLQELVKALPWYKLDTYRQRGIWRARIEWLERMKEPRLWLLYLMARRRRILKKASVRVLAALQRKRRRKLENGGVHERGRPPPTPSRDHEDLLGHMVMLSDATQTSTPLEASPSPPPTGPLKQPAMVSDAAQTSEHRLSHLTSRLRDSLSASRPPKAFRSNKRRHQTASGTHHAQIYALHCDRLVSPLSWRPQRTYPAI
jgi:hypothetical protein